MCMAHAVCLKFIKVQAILVVSGCMPSQPPRRYCSVKQRVSPGLFSSLCELSCAVFVMFTAKADSAASRNAGIFTSRSLDTVDCE